MYINFTGNNDSMPEDFMIEMKDLLIEASVLGDAELDKCYLAIFPNTGMKL